MRTIQSLRKVTFFVGVCLFPSILHAAVPHAINLQGRLTDPAGNPITKPISVEFRIYQGGGSDTADAGTIVYKEIDTITPGIDGVYTHLLGNGSAIQGYQFTSSVFDT